MNRRKHVSLVLVGLAVVVIAVWIAGLRRVEDWTFRYATMPATDKDLHDWLAGQPGVKGAEVWREGGDLRIRYHVGFWRPGPGLDKIALERFGYTGYSSSFMTSSNRWSL